jgi:hypothetical protein
MFERFGFIQTTETSIYYRGQNIIFYTKFEVLFSEPMQCLIAGKFINISRVKGWFNGNFNVE